MMDNVLRENPYRVKWRRMFWYIQVVQFYCRSALVFRLYVFFNFHEIYNSSFINKNTYMDYFLVIRVSSQRKDPYQAYRFILRVFQTEERGIFFSFHVRLAMNFTYIPLRVNNSSNMMRIRYLTLFLAWYSPRPWHFLLTSVLRSGHRGWCGIESRVYICIPF